MKFYPILYWISTFKTIPVVCNWILSGKFQLVHNVMSFIMSGRNATYRPGTMYRPLITCQGNELTTVNSRLSTTIGTRQMLADNQARWIILRQWGGESKAIELRKYVPMFLMADRESNNRELTAQIISWAYDEGNFDIFDHCCFSEVALAFCVRNDVMITEALNCTVRQQV